MFHDIQNTLSIKQAITSTTPTLSTDVYDTGKVGGSDISIGGHSAISALVVPTAVTVATGGIKIEILQSAASDMSSPDVIASKDVPAAQLLVNANLEVPFTQGSISKRYIALRYTGGNAALNTNVCGYLVPSAEIPMYKSFPKVYQTL